MTLIIIPYASRFVLHYQHPRVIGVKIRTSIVQEEHLKILDWRELDQLTMADFELHSETTKDIQVVLNKWQANFSNELLHQLFGVPTSFFHEHKIDGARCLNSPVAE